MSPNERRFPLQMIKSGTADADGGPASATDWKLIAGWICLLKGGPVVHHRHHHHRHHHRHHHHRHPHHRHYHSLLFMFLPH